MKPSYSPALLSAVLTLAISAPAALADTATPPPGFEPLFNGKDLTGWFGWATRNPEDLRNMTPEQRADWIKRSVEGPLEGKDEGNELNKHWSVENGELVNDGYGLYASTIKDYGDFELWLEYKTVPKADSGIYLRGCPQVQIWDSTENDEKAVQLGKPLGSGGLWNNSKGAPGKDPAKKMDRPFGEWNSFKIKMIGERVTVIFNGEVVVDNAVMENYFDKERKTPIFARGPIQLQTHGGEIRWRNIFIREISTEEANAALSAATSGQQGFTRLDNGKDLTGWVDAVDNYEVVDGAIVCKPGKGGNLLTAEEYGDLHLAFEFKLPLAGNNGIALRTPPKSSAAWDGLEIQILDTDGYEATKGALKPYQVHGSLYGLAAAARGFLRPTGEWNYQEIELVGQHLKVTLNGTKILDVNMDEIDTANVERVPKGLASRRGHVGFAGHNDPVAFRNLRIKRLD
jgi:hypothetical protein